MTDMAAASKQSSDASLPGRGWLGWLGRQVGHVRKAVKQDVTGEPQTVFRSSTVEERPLPEMPHVKLRRTTIDEVMIERQSGNRSQQD